MVDIKARSLYVKRKLDTRKRLLDNPIRMKQIQAYVRFTFDVFFVSSILNRTRSIPSKLMSFPSTTLPLNFLLNLGSVGDRLIFENVANSNKKDPV